MTVYMPNYQRRVRMKISETNKSIPDLYINEMGTYTPTKIWSKKIKYTYGTQISFNI
jgi:hypothetical protein